MTESLSGCVIRQKYHGQDRLVFVQHKRPDSIFRAVCEVARAAGGRYTQIGPRADWQDWAEQTDRPCRGPAGSPPGME